LSTELSFRARPKNWPYPIEDPTGTSSLTCPRLKFRLERFNKHKKYVFYDKSAKRTLEQSFITPNRKPIFPH